MAAGLTLLALLFEIMLGYPDRLMRLIGHPVTWMGALIGALDGGLNRNSAAAAARRMAGTITVLILIAAARTLAFIPQPGLLWLSFGLFPAALSLSQLPGPRTLPSPP